MNFWILSVVTILMWEVVPQFKGDQLWNFCDSVLHKLLVFFIESLYPMQCRHRVSPVGYFINLSYRLKRLFNTYGNTAISRQLRVQDVRFLVFQGWDSCFAQNKLGRDALHRLDYQNCLGNFWTVSKTMDLQSGYLISHIKETASVNRNGMHFHQIGQPFRVLEVQLITERFIPIRF